MFLKEYITLRSSGSENGSDVESEDEVETEGAISAPFPDSHSATDNQRFKVR